MNNLLEHILGAALVGVIIYSYLQTNKHRIRNATTTSSLLSSAYYATGGLWTGTALKLFSATVNWTLGTRDKTTEVPKKYLLGCISIYCILSYLCWEGPTTLIILLGQILNTIRIYIKDPYKVQLATLGIVPIFSTYNTITGMYWGVAIDTASIITVSYRLLTWPKPPKTE